MIKSFNFYGRSEMKAAYVVEAGKVEIKDVDVPEILLKQLK